MEWERERPSFFARALFLESFLIAGRRPIRHPSQIDKAKDHYHHEKSQFGRVFSGVVPCYPSDASCGGTGKSARCQQKNLRCRSTIAPRRRIGRSPVASSMPGLRIRRPCCPTAMVLVAGGFDCNGHPLSKRGTLRPSERKLDSHRQPEYRA